MKTTSKDVTGGVRGLASLALIPLLLCGCSAVQPGMTSTVDLERQIERQQAAYTLQQAPKKKKQLSCSEYERIGDIHMRNANINRAYYSYMKALALEPENGALLHKQGRILLQKKMFPDAEQVYLRIIKHAAKDGRALEGLGKALLGQSKINEAEKSLRAALELQGDLWQANQLLGLLYSKRGEYDRAVAEFKQALALQPTHTGLINNLAVTYSLQGQYEQAEQLLQDLAATTENKKVYNNLAVIYARLGRYAEALTAFKKGAEHEYTAYYNIGVEYLVNEKFDEAVAAFERAVALNPQYYPAAMNNLERARKKITSSSEH